MLLLAASCSLSQLTERELTLRENRLAWVTAFDEFKKLELQSGQANSALVGRIVASGKQPSAFHDEWKDLVGAYRDGPYRDGPYRFVLEGNFPRFSEVREVNDRILVHVEARVKELNLYVESFNEDQGESRRRELYDESEVLRKQNNGEYRAVQYAVDDLIKAWRNDPRIPITLRV